MEPKKLTRQQQKSIHVLFREIATALNDAGLTVQETLAHQMEMDWNERRVKELIWKQAQKKLLGKTSTTELNKQGDIDEVYDTVNRWLAKLEKEGKPLGIHVPFPVRPDWNEDAAPTKLSTEDL